MNILQITNKALFPPDGGTLAVLNLAHAYADLNHNVTILSMVTHKHYNSSSNISTLKKKNIDLIGIDVDTRISTIKLLKNLFFSKKPYNLERFINPNFSDKLIKLITQKDWDFIQIEGLYVLFYIDIIRKYYLGKIVYRPHNIEHKIWCENATNSKSFIKKIYFQIIAKRLKNFELEYLNSYDILLPISNFDANFYFKNGINKPLQVTPFGVNIEQLNSLCTQSKKSDNNPTILFIGALDWIPNQYGLNWFIKKCFPIVQKQVQNVELLIAGRNSPKWIEKKFTTGQIHFIGQIENAYEFIKTPGPLIVPLFSGSGTRVKIIEAMALKKAIITTSKGAEGIDGLNEKNILIADNPSIFAENIVELLKNKDMQIKIGNSANEFVINKYTIESIASKTIDFINQH